MKMRKVKISLKEQERIERGIKEIEGGEYISLKKLKNDFRKKRSRKNESKKR